MVFFSVTITLSSSVYCTVGFGISYYSNLARYSWDIDYNFFLYVAKLVIIYISVPVDEVLIFRCVDLISYSSKIGGTILKT